MTGTGQLAIGVLGGIDTHADTIHVAAIDTRTSRAGSDAHLTIHNRAAD